MKLSRRFEKSEVFAILDSLEDRFALCVENIIKPLQTQFEEFQEILQQGSQAVDTALEQYITMENEIQGLQVTKSKIQDKLMELENTQHFRNLKFQGFPELSEGPSDLGTFMMSWLSKVLQLEESVTPAIERTCHTGSWTRNRNGPPQRYCGLLYGHPDQK